MKSGRMIGLIMVLVFVLSPLAVFAQDEPKMQEFTSEDGLLTLMYPEEWTAQGQGEDTPLPAVFIANSDTAIEKLSSDEEDVYLDPGDVGMVIMLLPADFLSLLQIELPEDGGPVELTQAIVTEFMAPDESMDMATEEPPEIGEAEEIELSDGVTAGYVEVTDAHNEGAFIVYQPTDGIIALSYIAAYPGEFTSDLGDILKQVAATIQYTGTPGELMQAIMGGAMSASDSSDATSSSSEMDGEALVSERCTVCHTADRIKKADKDEAGWTSTVDRMIGYGAVLNADERQAVIDYLVATY